MAFATKVRVAEEASKLSASGSSKRIRGAPLAPRQSDVNPKQGYALNDYPLLIKDYVPRVHNFALKIPWEPWSTIGGHTLGSTEQWPSYVLDIFKALSKACQERLHQQHQAISLRLLSKISSKALPLGCVKYSNSDIACNINKPRKGQGVYGKQHECADMRQGQTRMLKPYYRYPM